MAGRKLAGTYYSFSYAGESSGWGHRWPYINLDDARRELMRQHVQKEEKYEVHSMYDIKFDRNGEPASFRRRLIGTLRVTKDGYKVKGVWKSKQTGKSYKVDPRNGKLVGRS